MAYFLRFQSYHDDAQVEVMKRAVGQQRLEKSLRLLRKDDVVRSLWGECFAKYLLMKKAGLKFNEIIFSQNEFGKPLLANNRNLHFNISHSGNLIGCALSDYPIGIDVEKCTDTFDPALAERYFTRPEIAFIHSLNKGREAGFYCIWTLKESYIKAIGKGLSFPLHSFSVVTNGKMEVSPLHSNQEFMKLRSYRICEDYVAAVCYHPSSHYDNDAVFINQDDFLEELRGMS
jgi:4'-phosphopantetheinyl transferase